MRGTDFSASFCLCLILQSCGSCDCGSPPEVVAPPAKRAVAPPPPVVEEQEVPASPENPTTHPVVVSEAPPPTETVVASKKMRRASPEERPAVAEPIRRWKKDPHAQTILPPNAERPLKKKKKKKKKKKPVIVEPPPEPEEPPTPRKEELEESIGGTLSDRKFYGALSNWGTIKDCLRDTRMRIPVGSGSLLVLFKIAPTGTVVRAKSIKPVGQGALSVASCVDRHAAKMRFPTFDGDKPTKKLAKFVWVESTTTVEVSHQLKNR